MLSSLLPPQLAKLTSHTMPNKPSIPAFKQKLTVTKVPRVKRRRAARVGIEKANGIEAAGSLICISLQCLPKTSLAGNDWHLVK